MAAQIWKTLHQSKDEMSFRLFLLLSAISAVIYIPWPITDYTPIHATLALILLVCSGLLSWQAWKEKPAININIAASVIGLLWALHIFLAHGSETHFIFNQVSASMMILFIGTISFGNNIDTFLLHCTPAAVTDLWLNSIDHRLQMLYFIALPTLGIMFQHIIHRRTDIYTELLMSQLVEEKETLSCLSKIDHLTGLFNRRGFEDRLEQIQSHGESNQHYVLLIDIDNFKLYNDHYGHGMGDRALSDVAAVIRDTVRSRDIVSRYGGEEFLVLVTDIDQGSAIQAADRIRQRVYNLGIVHKFNNDVTPRITVSIGIAALRDRKIEDAIILADAALYQAKHQGRNTSILANEGETQIV